jgi:hypothetical protein
MAIRSIAQLKAWFKRGSYPTEAQFADWIDSFFHRDDKVPISSVEGLSGRLNDKYARTDGEELERKHQRLAESFEVHVKENEIDFASIHESIGELEAEDARLDGRITDEVTRATGEETTIRQELAAGDAATLRSAEEYTDTSVADEAQKRTQGDAATLQSARSHTDTEIASERTARESGDRTTLQSAKEYVDRAIAELIDGSPAALDTLKELSNALGDDPNFATTVATQIGTKVDKVAGKGLSTEDYTSAEKAKLAGVAAGANNYTHPSSHPASIITQDGTHRFVSDSEKSTWNGKASTAVATQSANGLMSAGDKTKLDTVPNNASSDYRSIPFSVMLGAVCGRVEMKIAAGLVIIRTRITFTDKNAVITTPSHSIQSMAVVDTYAMYISKSGIEPGVRIRINGNTRTAGFVFEVPDSILNQEVAIHCAIPVFSCGQASKEEPLNAIQTFLRS